MKTDDLRFFVCVHFPRWISKSPLYFDNIKPELPHFIDILKQYFSANEIDTFSMDWVLNMTSLDIRKKVNKIKEAKNELEFIIWENKVIQTINEASEDELLFYAVIMYLDLKEHPFAEMSILSENQAKPITKYKWFDVGLKFADGSIKEHDRDKYCSFKEMTIKLGLEKNQRTYVSTTYTNISKGDKNIFAHLKKMQPIYDYCIKNKIIVSDWFLKEYTNLKQNE